MRCTMGLLKLVIVDDEPILLEGLVKTYDWNGMGYEVVGFAQSGEQALKVIREKKPHVVLTDIRMKQISGLMVLRLSSVRITGMKSRHTHGQEIIISLVHTGILNMRRRHVIWGHSHIF